MHNDCRICHDHAPEDRYLCDGCEHRARTWLTGLPAQEALLRRCLLPTAGPAQRGGAGRAHAPLPLDLRPLDLLGPGTTTPVQDPHGDQVDAVPIKAILAGWAQRIAEDIAAVYVDHEGKLRTTGQGPACAVACTGSGISAWVAWLHRYWPWAITRPYIEPLYTDLAAITDRIQRITHTEPRRTARDAPCPECEGFSMFEREGELHIFCGDCGHRMTPDAYMAHRAKVMPPLVHIALLMQGAREQARQAAA